MHMGERERGWNVVGMGIGDIKAEGEGGGGGTTVTIHGSDDRRGLVGMHALVHSSRDEERNQKPKQYFYEIKDLVEIAFIVVEIDEYVGLCYISISLHSNLVAIFLEK
ncbi:hypothetical protein L1887_35921 [Cichorium endivia]|nr:hypothetical protein L1887_35921 [Cichorium endivia]